MTFEEWHDTHKPIKNHLDTNAAFDGEMFETFGPELDFIRAQRHDKVWTWIETDGEEFIVDGYHHVNRLGYFITEVPHALDETVEIPISDDHDYSEEDKAFLNAD